MSFKFTSLAHMASTVFHDIKVGVSAADKYFVGHMANIQADAQLAVTAISIVDPQVAAVAAMLDRGGEYLLGKAFEAIKTADAAASANGVNLTLDAALVADLKDLFESASKVKALPAATAFPTVDK